MDIILMHKNDLVAKLIFTDAGYFQGIEGFYNKELMPPGTRVQDAVAEQRFKIWMESRCFPKEREGYIKLLSKMGVNTQEQFYFRNYGLSLNDCYWFRALDSFSTRIGWEQINFFKNSYSDSLGDFLTDPSFEQYTIDFMSPDLTTTGIQEKMWYQDAKLDSYLLKLGTKENNYQEVFFECAASKVADCLRINHSRCILVNKEQADGTFLYVSMSKNFCNENVEFVPANLLIAENGFSTKNAIINYIKKNNLKSELDRLLVFDYIVCNTNRNLSNFGFLRDANTLQIIGLAPSFGHSNVLWSNYKKEGVGNNETCKLFESTQTRQLQLVDDFTWINFDLLSNINIELKEVFRESEVPQPILNQIYDEVDKRISILKETAKEHAKKKEFIKKEEKRKIEEEKTKITLSEPSSGFGM